MRPTRLIPPESDPIDDLDAPAFTRALTPLPEIQRRLAMQAADREDANNRSFNRQFWATMASEAGAPSGILTAHLGRWLSRVTGRQNPAG
ncbi:MAG: hypothetical protein ACM37V_08210 [Gemmatimonadota bacterium]